MSFLITSYIYPIKEKVTLSKRLNFYLDNPRTDTDIEVVRDYWLRAHNAIPNKQSIPVYSENALFALETFLFFIRDRFANTDKYLARIFTDYRREDFFGFLARITILAYFEDESDLSNIDNKLKRAVDFKNEGIHDTSSDDDVLELNVRRLVSYSHLLSLLIHSEGEGYNGLSFIIDTEDPTLSRISPPRLFVWINYISFGACCVVHKGDDFKDDDTSEGERLWMTWPTGYQRLIERSQVLENAFENDLTEKLLYLGSMLEMAKHSQDEKLRLVMLTSILELLLTHNPAFDRFNVEDSINKQFQLKTSILVYLNDKRRDINAIQKRLKTIYQQRSNIVHGNFGEVDKYVRGLSKKKEREEYFSNLLTDLYIYVRAVMEEYLRDRGFVEFLKEN